MGSPPFSSRRNLKSARPATPKLGVLVSGLIEAGVIETPFEIERRYLDRRLHARIEACGNVTCLGRTFGTLSSAASYARSTCEGGEGGEGAKPSSNGWTFWQFRNDAGELECIGSLRRRFLKG